MDYSQYPVALVRGQGTPLPFKLLVIAPLIASEQMSEISTAVAISTGNFDQVLKSFAPQIEVLTMEPMLLNYFTDHADVMSLLFTIKQFDDFLPHKILRQQPCLAKLQGVLDSLHLILQGEQEAYSNNDFCQLSLSFPKLQAGCIPRRTVELLVCELERVLSRVIDSVLHHQQWQQIESAWRGLLWLCRDIDPTAPVELHIMAADRNLLADDLKHAVEVEDSRLFEHIYTESMGQFGGVPFGAVLLDDYFNAQQKDIDFLSRLIEVFRHSQTPLITGVSAQMFSVSEFSHLQEHDCLTELFASPRYLKWRAFCQSEQANYLVLTLPRVKFRDSFLRAQSELLWYQESIGEDSEHCLWGNACYAMALNLFESFSQFGFCTFLSGEQHGLISLDNLNKGADKLPVEINIPEDKEAQLIHLGMNPVITRAFRNIMLFPVANTLAWAQLSMARHPSASQMANAQLHYLFIVTRIIHCLKIIFRETLGATASREDITQQLNHWLKQYISDMESPSASVVAKRPLRQAKVSVKQTGGSQVYDISVELSPHLKFVGSPIAFSADLALEKG